jgi:hypothetical protein
MEQDGVGIRLQLAVPNEAQLDAGPMGCRYRDPLFKAGPEPMIVPDQDAQVGVWNVGRREGIQDRRSDLGRQACTAFLTIAQNEKPNPLLAAALATPEAVLFCRAPRLRLEESPKVHH